MPNPNAGESQSDFVARCIPVVLDDGTAETQQQAVAVCFSMWEQAKEKSLPDKTIESVTDTEKDFTGAMVGMFLPLPVAVALDMVARDLPFYVERTKARDYHLTLAFLGNMLETELPQDAIKKAVAEFAETQEPIKGRLEGMGRFEKTENGENAIYANFDSPELPEFRQKLVDALRSAGVFQNPEHGFTPHITLGYMWDDIEETPHLEMPGIDFELDKLTLAFGENRTEYQLGASETEKQLSTFSVYKDKSGDYRWVSLSGNSYKDLERQIVSQKALEQDVSRIEPDNDYGPLRWWHMGGYDLSTKKATPGVDVGDCDWRMMHGKFLIESGTFRNQEFADAFKDFDGQVSIRFLHSLDQPDNDGVFHKIHTVERSLVPNGRAANPFTSFQVTEENIPMNEKAKALQEKLKDPAMVSDLLEAVEAHEKTLDEKGVTSKENKSLLDKLKALIGSEDKESDTEEPTAITAKGISEAISAGFVTAMKEMSAQNAKTDLEDDTEKAQKKQVVNLTTRIERLEGDVTDANVELKAAQKELSELVGDEGHRASMSPETVIDKDAKKELGPNADGLKDFQDQMMNAQ